MSVNDSCPPLNFTNTATPTSAATGFGSEFFDTTQLLFVTYTLIFMAICYGGILLANIHVFFLGVSPVLISYNKFMIKLVEWRDRSNVYFNRSKISLYTEILFALLSLISVGIFIYMCVAVSIACNSDHAAALFVNNTWTYNTEFVISILFAIYYVFQLIISTNPSRFLISFWNVADLITIISGIFSRGQGQYTWFFVNLRFLRFYRSMKYLKKWGWSVLNGPNSALIFYVVGLLTYVFCAAGFIFVTENSVTTSGGQVADILDAPYFIVITLTTVGYGDINAVSSLGRVIVILIIIGALIIIPSSTAKLLRILASRATSKVAFDTSFVVVFSQSGADRSSFIEQFFHKDRTKNKMLGLAYVTEGELHPNMKALFKQKFYSPRVTVLKGHLAIKRDIDRAKISKADAVFLLSDGSEDSSEVADARTIVTSLILKNMSPNLPIFAQIVTQEQKLTAISRGLNKISCSEELKMSFFASSCIYPGLSTLLSNLLTVITARARDYYQHNSWLNHFEYGIGNELYTSLKLTKFVGMNFSSACLYIYSTYGVLLLGVRRAKTGKIYLNPYFYLIEDQDGGIFIAQDGKLCEMCVSGDETVDQMMKELGDGILIKSYSEPDKTKSKIRNRDGSNRENGGKAKFVESKKLLALSGAAHDLVKRKKKEKKFSPRTNPDVSHHGNIAGQQEDKHAIHTIVTESLKSHFLFSKTLLDFNACTLHTIPQKWQGHIVVSAEVIPRGVFNFILHLRKKSLSNSFGIRPIVLFSPNLIEENVWKRIGVFPALYFVRGDFMSPTDQRRAGVATCLRYVILNTSNVDDVIDTDAKVLVAFKTAKEINSKAAVCEIIYAENLRFLQPSVSKEESRYSAPEREEAGSFRSAYYASGQVFLPSILDTVLCQTYFNAGTINVVESFLTSSKMSAFKLSDWDDFTYDPNDPPYYSVVMNFLLSKSILPFGLLAYCEPWTERFIISSPSPDTLVGEEDIIYGLRPCKVPKMVVTDEGDEEEEDSGESSVVVGDGIMRSGEVVVDDKFGENELDSKKKKNPLKFGIQSAVDNISPVDLEDSTESDSEETYEHEDPLRLTTMLRDLYVAVNDDQLENS